MEVLFEIGGIAAFVLLSVDGFVEGIVQEEEVRPIVDEGECDH